MSQIIEPDAGQLGALEDDLEVPLHEIPFIQRLPWEFTKIQIAATRVMRWLWSRWVHFMDLADGAIPDPKETVTFIGEFADELKDDQQTKEMLKLVQQENYPAPRG
jgi:hypothetical protein